MRAGLAAVLLALVLAADARLSDHWTVVQEKCPSHTAPPSSTLTLDYDDKIQ
eukprot:gene3896-4250_t